MTPGVFLAVRLPLPARAASLWSDVRAGMPDGWSWQPGHPALCAAIGVDPADFVTVVGPPVDGRSIALSVLRNGAELQITNVIAADGATLGGRVLALAVSGFVLACVRPRLPMYPDAVIDVPAPLGP